MYDYYLFLKRLRQAKKDKKITIEEIAEISGVPASTIDKIFTGTTQNPRVNSLIAIAEALDTTLDYLLYGRVSTTDQNSKNILVKYFNELNESGRNKTIAYAKDLASSPIYKSVN